MDVKGYLNQIKEKEEKIDEQIMYVQGLRESMYSIPSPDFSSERVKTTPERDRLLRIIGQIEEEEQKLKKMQEDFCVFRVQVINQIHQIEDLTLNKLLMLKYVYWKENPTLAVVAEKLNYSYDYIKELHSKAIWTMGLMFLP